MTTEYSLVEWNGIVKVGDKVVDDSGEVSKSWESLVGYQYNNGYSCIRLLYNKTTNLRFKVVCIISCSNLKNPLFCAAVNNENSAEITQLCATNPTTLVKKIFEFAEIAPNRKYNGNHFFGLHRKDVKSALKNADSIVSIENIIASESVSITSPITPSRNATWLGVKEFGIPRFNDEKYKVDVGKHSFRLQPGYEAMRSLKLDTWKKLKQISWSVL